MQIMGRGGLRASEVAYPANKHLRWSYEDNVSLFEVRGKNTKGGERKVRDAWMPESVADDVHKYSRERELAAADSWVQASTPSVRRWVKEAAEHVAEHRVDERWGEVLPMTFGDRG